MDFHVHCKRQPSRLLTPVWKILTAGRRSRQRGRGRRLTLDIGSRARRKLRSWAVRLVAETRRCSTSWLQRKLGLGYNRAARIVEMMEKRGLVGPANGAKDRDVLVDPS